MCGFKISRISLFAVGRLPRKPVTDIATLAPNALLSSLAYDGGGQARILIAPVSYDCLLNSDYDEYSPFEIVVGLVLSCNSRVQ